ncbi:proteasome assembly chaperone 1 [Sinocyclocheilus anshuiensis]|uniref:Proteasome assembly chaperone 1 n=1 Tax=Sinocyclocheilus anshuiensis TaxID=1608454 RepID=A0A671K680_9TELE|nr:PREDICTED: proteasome assembly chaperone 1 [Sinocyclocheilus anshuiensis]
MATFFGEVLSVYSRAVEEDEDDDMTNENEEDAQIRREIEEKRSVDVHWLSQTDGSVPCSDLIIAVGPNATGFVSAHVLRSGGWTAVAWVSLWNERSPGSGRADTAPGPGEPSCILYQQKHSPSVLLCQCSCYVAEDQQFQWTEKVLGCVQTRDLTVTVLSDCSVAEYKTSDYLSESSVPFLRSLRTSAHTGPVASPALEQPNISTGLAAAVLSHCQVQRIAAVLYQCYSDVLQPDSLSMQTYRAAVSAVLKLDPTPSADVLQKITRGSELQSNLYT